jgi:zinc protease
VTGTVETISSGRVEEVTSPGGIHAYLLSDPCIPAIALSLHFRRAGAASDPADRLGLAQMASSLLDQGAGPHDSQAFQTELEDNAIRLSFDVDRDGLTGDLKTLNATRDHAFELLRLALLEPRFDAEPVGRVRSQTEADLRRRETDPGYLAGRAWFSAAFPDHPYGRPTLGLPATLAAIGVDDLQGFTKARLARDNLLIGVAGDITAAELAPLLDRTFGGLPGVVTRSALDAPAPFGGDLLVVRRQQPQSLAMFGHAGIGRHDPDRYAAAIANHILGGGGFSSRLMEEIREKRGLAYSVHTQLLDTELAPLWLGSVATKNEQVGQSLALLRAELARMAGGEVGEEELADARTYLTGSFPLRLTSNDQVAKMLEAMLVHRLGIDYLDRRNGYIEAVTLADLQRAAARLFDQPVLISVVGEPEGVTA